MKYLLSIGLVIILAACASGRNGYVQSMMRFQGQPEARLVDALGPPNNVYEVDGTRYLTYTKASQHIYNAGPEFGYGFGSHNSGVALNQSVGNGATIQTSRCDVFFAVRNRLVTKVGHRGDAC